MGGMRWNLVCILCTSIFFYRQLGSAKFISSMQADIASLPLSRATVLAMCGDRCALMLAELACRAWQPVLSLLDCLRAQGQNVVLHGILQGKQSHFKTPKSATRFVCT